jgi:A/G-specific adenine glycosylase
VLLTGQKGIKTLFYIEFMNIEKQFAPLLLKWNDSENDRHMPWKGERNPYYIWLSEIILQQTRVEQGLPYFLNFKQKYPVVKDLAMAPEDEVMKLWQGLGYYSRARNLHETAKNIHTNHGGKFPENFEGLVKLKGVGEYTASAIASFAFGERKAVVDGNVIRVLSRVFGIDLAADTTKGKKKFASLAQQLIDANHPGLYNQAIMDFGAVVCMPVNPRCDACPFQRFCNAYQQNRIDTLPVKKKKIKVLNRYFNYLVIKNGNEIFINKRTGSDIWKNLYELPLLETSRPLKKNIKAEIAAFLGHKNFDISAYSEGFVQLLTHRKIHTQFIEIELNNLKTTAVNNAQKIKLAQLDKYAFPKTVHLFLKQKKWVK